MNIFNFIEEYKIPKKICDDLITYYKKNTEYKNIGQTGSGINKKIKDSTDVYFYNDSKNETIQSFFNLLSNCVTNYCKKYSIKDTIKTYVCNNIQYYKPKGGYPSFHYERNSINPKRILAYMLYCNTVTDKGGTEFLYQNITLSAVKGKLVIWPADFTHLHRGVISPTQKKYIATGWFEII